MYKTWVKLLHLVMENSVAQWIRPWTLEPDYLASATQGCVTLHELLHCSVPLLICKMGIINPASLAVVKNK